VEGMKSYIKIYGPPVLKAIQELEKLAIDMPQVCIMDSSLEVSIPEFTGQGGGFIAPGGEYGEAVISYFSAYGNVPKTRCDNIVSKSGEKVGDSDFYFEWFKKPSVAELNQLIEKIDKVLDTIGARYSISTH
jgi:hypothetical protein